jgi:hypothetical protein
LQETGRYDDHLVEDLPEPKIELHRDRRHIQKPLRPGVSRTRGAGGAEVLRPTSVLGLASWPAIASRTWGFPWARPARFWNSGLACV